MSENLTPDQVIERMWDHLERNKGRVQALVSLSGIRMLLEEVKRLTLITLSDHTVQPMATAPKDGRAILITRTTQFPHEEGWHVVRWEDDWWFCHDGKFDTPMRGGDPEGWISLPNAKEPT